MSLLPPIVEVLTGDISSFSSSMNQAMGKLDEVDRLSTGVSKRQVQAVSMGLLAIGGAFTGVGGVLVAISDPIEKAQATLRQVIENTGASWAAYAGKVDAAVSSEARFGHGSADTQTALGKLTAAYQDPTKALAEMALTTDIAAFKHIDLAAAAAIVVRMHAGAAKTFKEFGINITDMSKTVAAATKANKDHATAVADLQKAQQSLSDLEARDAGKKQLTIADEQALTRARENVALATQKVTDTNNASIAATNAAKNATTDHEKQMAMLEQRLHGVAQAQAETFGGHLDEYRTRILNLAGAVGKDLGPVLIGLGPLLMGIGGALQIAVIPGFMAAAAPILAVAAGVAAVGAAFYLAYTHIQPFRGAVDGLAGVISGAAGQAFSWLSGLANNIGTAFRDIYPAAALIANTAFPPLWKAAQNVFAAFGDIIGTFAHIFTGFGDTGAHADTAAAGLRGAAGAADTFQGSIVKIMTSPGVISFQTFLAVWLPNQLTGVSLKFKLVADDIATMLDAMILSGKLALDLLTGNFTKFGTDAQAGVAQTAADISRSWKDGQAIDAYNKQQSDGTIQKQADAFAAGLLGTYAGLGGNIDTHTEGMATTTQNAFNAMHNAAAGSAASTRDLVIGDFAGMAAGVVLHVNGMAVTANQLFQQMAYNITRAAAQLGDSISGHSIIPDMAKRVVKSFDWMKGESLGHWADMSKGITAHAQGMASPGASAWGGGSLATAGGGSRGGGNITVGQIVINGANKDPRQIATEVRDELLRMKRTTGTLGLA